MVADVYKRQALGFLKTKRVQNFLKGNSKRSRVVELTDGYMPVEKPENCCEEDNNDINNIKSMDIDGLLKTPHLPDERNPYTYYNKLEVDILDVDMAGILQLASKIISEIDKQYENMRYLEKEMDLRICDTRHFKKNDDTKLSEMCIRDSSKYHACSMAIRALREVIGDPAAMDKVTDSSLIYELDSRGYNVDNLIEILHKIKS